MLFLTIRTDKPESEIGLYDGKTQLAYEAWQAHRQLAETIHYKIDEVLKTKGKALADIEGIVAFQGPGSFTGLRIGLSVANALAYGLDVPIIPGTSDNWLADGIDGLLAGDGKKAVMPEYGAPVHITLPKSA